MTLTRRQFLLSGGAMTATLAGWSHWIEPGWLCDRAFRVPILAQASGGVRLAHLSDFHAWNATPLSYVAHAVDRALQSRPDLIAITGDFITRQIIDRDAYLRILERLPHAAPTFAIFGNHDGGAWARRAGGLATTDEVRRLLEDAGMRVLWNEAVDISVGDIPLRLVGLGDLWAGELQAERAFHGSAKPHAGPTIVLSHNPDSKELLKDYAWDLMLSGHTHGGQVIVPFVGAAPFAPVEDKRFLRGLHEWEARLLHVSAGVGNLHGVRFNCPPEWSELTLVPKEKT